MKHRLLFTGKKLIRMALLLLGVSLVAFLLMSASPLDPLKTNVGQAALGSMSQEQIAKLEDYWGVNDPPVERYLGWLGDFVRGDMGTSLLYRQPVSQVIGQRLQNSLWLMAFAWVISGVLGLTLGVIAGANRGKLVDKLIRGYCWLISSTPAFWLALVLLVVFSVWLGLFPIGLSVPIGADAADVTLADRLSARPYLEHHRGGQYRHAHPGEDGRHYGAGLCAVCPCQRGVYPLYRAAPRSA